MCYTLLSLERIIKTVHALKNTLEALRKVKKQRYYHGYGFIGCQMWVIIRALDKVFVEDLIVFNEDLIKVFTKSSSMEQHVFRSGSSSKTLIRSSLKFTKKLRS